MTEGQSREPTARIDLTAAELRLLVDALFLKREMELRDRLVRRLLRLEARMKRFDGRETVA